MESKTGVRGRKEGIKLDSFRGWGTEFKRESAKEGGGPGRERGKGCTTRRGNSGL